MVLTRAADWVAQVTQLRGLRINIGAPASGSEVTFRRLLAARGWSASQFGQMSGVRASLQASALCAGRVDAISFVAANPVPVMQEATFSCDARFVPLDQEFARSMLERYPYYVPAEVPGGLYPNNPDPVPTIGVRAVVVASSATPDDVVYADHPHRVRATWPSCARCIWRSPISRPTTCWTNACSRRCIRALRATTARRGSNCPGSACPVEHAAAWPGLRQSPGSA